MKEQPFEIKIEINKKMRKEFCCIKGLLGSLSVIVLCLFIVYYKVITNFEMMDL